MNHPPNGPRLPALLVFGLLALASSGEAQQPRRGERPAISGTISRIAWSEDGKSLQYSSAGKSWTFDLESLVATEAEGESEGDESPRNARTRRRRGSSGASTGTYVGRPTRGRQYTQVDSPDSKWEAHYRDWNVVLESKDGADPVQVTDDGNAEIHYGTASWVYGEELNQTRAMWWTPDSKKLLFYRFDDTGVLPFHLVRSWSDINTNHYPEFYPKAGAKNPAAWLMVYDLESGKTVEINAGGGSEEYLFNIRASASGDTMLVNWTDRLQRHLKVLAMDLETGACRTVVEERQDTWQSNSPSMRYLEDKQRFLWQTDKSGYTHYELRDLDGKLHNPVTNGECQTGSIDFVDEAANLVGFTSFSSPANPYYQQYHLVGLDGKNPRRVSTLDVHHSSFNVSPNRQWLVARHEDVNRPPTTVLYRTDGSVAATLAESDPASAANLAETFQFKSDDGKFDIYGVLYKPSKFDPDHVYPLINALYGGPGSSEFSYSYVSRERSECAKGYLVVKVKNRGTGGRGKAFLGAAYGRLGDVDIQDHADAVRLLRERPYIDGDRVGIIGHSYGGYMSAMGVLKHADVYRAASVGAGVTDWRNYDTIYTERYMSTPQLNAEGYDTGSAMKYVDRFKGHILILHGMVDDNVHPTNAFQLIDALDQAGKSYESRFWPNSGHGLGRGSTGTIWGFFNRVLTPDGPQASED